MADPGWYPDPEGRPRHFRYWDGSRWGISTTPAPGAPDPKRPNFWLVAVIVAIVLGLLGIVGWRLAADQDPASIASPTPIGRQNDGPIPATSPPSSPQDSAASAVPCPVVVPDPLAKSGAELSSAGLTVQVPAGWSSTDTSPARGLIAQASAVRTFASSGWVSFISVGIAPTEAGFSDPRLTAQQLFECHVTGGMFRGLSESSALLDEAVTLGGVDGWRMRLHADSSAAPGGGATYELVVVDAGEPAGLSVFWGGVVDADTTALAQVMSIADGLVAD